MNRRLMSWIALAVLVVGLSNLASGFGTLIATMPGGTMLAISPFAQIGAGVVSWIWGVRLSRAAHPGVPAKRLLSA